MKIFISIVRFKPGKTLGSEVYLRSMLRALAEVSHDEEIFIAASKETVEWGKKLAPEFTWVPLDLSRSIIRRILSESSEIDKLASKYEADVLFFPFNIMPKVSTPSVLLVHDLVNELYSRKFPMYRPVYYQTVKTLIRRSIKRADNLITISRVIADDLNNSKFMRSDQQVFVAPLASQPVNDKRFRPKELPDDGRKIILQTGEHLPHKSHITGIKAMSELSKNNPEIFAELRLVLTGGQIQNKKLKQFVKDNQIDENITFLGKVTNEELEWLMQEADLICFPTIYEGFGLGIIEAQLRGKPIVVSDIPVLREVSGNAAIFFEAENFIELAEKIRNSFRNGFEYSELVLKGRHNARKLSWESHARKILEVLKKTAEHKKTH